MRKEDISGLVVYLIIFAVAIIYGFAVLQPHFAKSTFELGIMYALFILGAIAVAIIGCAILLEVGHIIGAKIGGYEVVSVCILHFMFYKDNGKFKFKFANFDGLTGETKIRPKDENSNPKAFLLLGTLLISLFIVAGAIIFYLNADATKSVRGDMAYFALTVAVVSGVCLIYNIIPLKLDAINDGYRLAMVSNPKNKEAFNELLRVEYEVSQGNENVEIKTFTELTNFTAELNLNKIYVLLDKKEYKEADELIDIVLNNKSEISSRIYIQSLAMKIFVSVMYKTVEEVSQFVTDNVDLDARRLILQDNSLVCIRAYLLLAGLFDNSQNECKVVLEKVYKAYKRTPKNRREVELTMFNDALQLVIDAHPKWELEKYKLEA